jgi:hypothetical protein
MSAQIRETREIVREEPFMRSRILQALAGGALTVPEIAAAIDRPTHEAMYWVMGMRRYGYVREVKEAAVDGYFRYFAVEKETRA